ncbi:MAG: OadG family protein [Lachnospiraceae bacterium]|nr:OadG family protein [Lachnospiraceae bacterium]
MKKRILPLFLAILPVLGLTACSEELKTTLLDAGMNTLVGMGVVFVILILISLVISAFRLINTAQDKAAKRKEAKLTKKTPEEPEIEEPAAIEEEQDETDDLELVAVIAAAIAASENTDPSGIIVRSIRKVSSANHWKRG